MEDEKGEDDPTVPSGPGGQGGRAPGRPPVTAERARRMARAEFARRLEALLLETGGNLAEIGRRLGRDRSTIRYHLRRLGMLGKPPKRQRPEPPEGESF